MTTNEKMLSDTIQRTSNENEDYSMITKILKQIYRLDEFLDDFKKAKFTNSYLLTIKMEDLNKIERLSRGDRFITWNKLPQSEKNDFSAWKTRVTDSKLPFLKKKSDNKFR